MSEHDHDEPEHDEPEPDDDTPEQVVRQDVTITPDTIRVTATPKDPG